jgi:Zn-dependent protease
MNSGLFDFLSEAAVSFLLLLGLLSFLGLRRPISVRASDFIAKPAADVFAIVDFSPGSQAWHRGEAVVRLVDEARHLYRVTYTTISPGSADHVAEADFAVVKREPPYRMVADRDGLGRRVANQLLRIDATIADEPGGCRLTLQYDWGPRSLLAHVLARMDIRSSVNRIKSYAETGAVDHTHETRIGIVVAVLTGALSVALFGLWLGWLSAALLIVVLGVHEFGHLLAFRMIGQPWGRMLFIPFLGALAVPRLPFRSEAEHVFAALMGPGFSVLLLIAAIALTIAGVPYAGHLVFVTALINGLNLLPVLPLDGGHAIRAILQSVAPRHIRLGITLCAILIAAAGFFLRQPILLAVALIAAFGAGSGERRIGAPRVRMGIGASAVAVIALLLLGALYAGILFWGAQARPLSST